MTVEDSLAKIENVRLAKSAAAVAGEVRDEVVHRLRFLNRVGLGYLTLGRSADSLAGGEAQRIRLATQIGSRLVGVLYVLDEPSIGLHPRDNRRLLDEGPPASGQLRVSIAEHQTAGRGRRGRRWQSPPGGGIWLSVSWLFDRQPPELTALGLAAGLAVRRALVGAGIGGVMLKWPNDLVHGDRKLGGVLAELREIGRASCRERV